MKDIILPIYGHLVRIILNVCISFVFFPIHWIEFISVHFLGFKPIIILSSVKIELLVHSEKSTLTSIAKHVHAHPHTYTHTVGKLLWELNNKPEKIRYVCEQESGLKYERTDENIPEFSLSLLRMNWRRVPTLITDTALCVRGERQQHCKLLVQLKK